MKRRWPVEGRGLEPQQGDVVSGDGACDASGMITLLTLQGGGESRWSTRLPFFLFFLETIFDNRAKRAHTVV